MLNNLNLREIINKPIKLDKSKTINLVIFIAFGIITFLTSSMHECWRDESQAWLLTRDIPIFDLLFSQLKYEGHPGVWYIILLPFAKLGFPFQIINYISWLIMMIAAYFIIYKSKIDTMAKVALLLTTPFIYYYSVIGRSYCVISLLMIGVAYLYGKRKEHPYLLALLLALLMNTHLLALGFVAMLTIIVYIYEPLANIISNRKRPTKEQVYKIFFPIFIIGFAGIMLLLQVRPWEHSNTVIDTDISRFSKEEAYKTLINTIKTVIGNMVPYKSFYYGYYILIPLMLLLGIHNYRKESIICFCAILFQICLFAFVIKALAHTSFVILVTLGCYLWMVKDKASNGTKAQKIVASIIEIVAFIVFALNLMVSYQYVIYDLKDEFSASKQTANFINNNIEENANFITTYDVKAQPIIPYTNEKYHFYSLDTKQEFTYITWDQNRYNKITYKDFKDAIDNSLKENKPTYVIYVYGSLAEYVVNMQDDYNVKKLYSDFNTYQGVVRESYIIYEIDGRK